MDCCIICLEPNEDISYRITTNSSEWVKGKMQKIIEKHLWWLCLQPPGELNFTVRWICRKCWSDISTFHQFYVKVVKAHRFYQPYVKKIHKTNDKKVFKEAQIERHLNLEAPDNETQFFKEGIGEGDVGKLENQNIETFEKPEFITSTDECDISGNILYEDLCINRSFSYMEEVVENKMISVESITKANILINPTSNISCSTKNFRNEKNIRSVGFENFLKETQHKLECCICDKSLSDFRSLKVHYRDEHDTRGYSICCGKKYYKRCLLIDHLKVHTNPSFFKCEPCVKTFATRRGLELHLESHKTRERKYSCDKCEKSYFKLHTYERHKLTHVPEIERNFQCSQCDKKFATDHIRRQHEDVTHGRKYAKICEVCGKSFSHSYTFSRHMQEHAGTTPSMETCEICGVKLTNKYGLRQHIKMRHLEENLQEQICPYCSKVSPNLNAHRMHIKYTHTMERKHACNFCEKAFRRPLELKEHLSTHTGEALYTCPHCPRTFISNGNMHKHRKTVHRKEWEASRLNKLNKSCIETI